ncbi:MAG: hypothetical protein ACRC2H_11595 [Silanimonas sp.]
MSPATLTLIDAHTPASSRTSEFQVLSLAPERVAAAKRAFTTRRLPIEHMQTLLSGDTTPRAGDLVLARVTRLGKHRELESPTGRRCRLFPGDEIIVAYGNRYAPDQFEAEVPTTLAPCHLVAGGGVAARMIGHHAAVKTATEIDIIGLIGDERGQVLRTQDSRLPAIAPPRRRPFTIAVAGTSMNAGKTTAAASLVYGAAAAGLRVGAAKVTGTGSGGDTWLLRDAGARKVIDFTDAGMVSTYKAPASDVEEGFSLLLAHLAADEPDVIVIEIADGLYQTETAALICSPRFGGLVDATFFAAGDAMGAAAGADWLARRGRPVLGVTGVLTQSPLAMREAAIGSGLPVLTLADLEAPDFVAGLLAEARLGRKAQA